MPIPIVLIGAGAGIAWGLAGLAAVSLWRRRWPTTEEVVLTICGGALAGGVGGLFFRAIPLAQATPLRHAVAYGTGGAVGNVAETTLEEAHRGRAPPPKRLLGAAAIGFGTGVVSAGSERALGAVARRTLGRPNAFGGAPATTTGGGMTRTWLPAEPAEPRAPPSPEQPAPASRGFVGALGE